METGAELRAARRAASLTLSDVASLGGVTVGHLSRIEKGQREVTPATVTLYHRAISAVEAREGSPTVDDVRRRDLLALAAVPVAAALPGGRARRPDSDECAQWLAWEMWRASTDSMPASAVPPELAASVATLVRRRYVLRGADGSLRFPSPGMLDFYLASTIFDGVLSGSGARLEAAQTTHNTDMILAEFVGSKRTTNATLTRWMTGAESPVLRVNAAGILAKLRTPQATDRVVCALRADKQARALYLAAVASRVMGMPWDDAVRVATGAATAGHGAGNAFAIELRNPHDGAARWCAAVLIYQTGAVSQNNVRAAVVDALRAEVAAENLRTVAALAAGADPVNV